MTREDLGYKPGVVEKVKFEYSPLVFRNKVKNKTDKRNKIKKKEGKNIFYNSQHSFVKLKDISDFEELPLDSA